MSTALPLVTCIMPTRNRPDFVKRSIELFQAQDYPRKHLLIFEDGEGEHSVDQPPPENVIYVRSPLYNSIGAKRNAMCAMAGSDLIAHWDDDDWQSPRRLSTQIEAMRSQGARLCGADRLVFLHNCAHGFFATHPCPFNIAQGDHPRAWLFQTVRKPWLAGGTFMYERSLWQEQPFTEVSNGEDVAFLDAAYKRGVKIANIADPSLYVAMLHGANTTTRNIDAQWGGFDVETVRQWMGG